MWVWYVSVGVRVGVLCECGMWVWVLGWVLYVSVGVRVGVVCEGGCEGGCAM